MPAGITPPAPPTTPASPAPRPRAVPLPPARGPSRRGPAPAVARPHRPMRTAARSRSRRPSPAIALVVPAGLRMPTPRPRPDRAMPVFRRRFRRYGPRFGPRAPPPVAPRSGRASGCGRAVAAARWRRTRKLSATRAGTIASARRCRPPARRCRWSKASPRLHRTDRLVAPRTCNEHLVLVRSYPAIVSPNRRHGGTR